MVDSHEVGGEGNRISAAIITFNEERNIERCLCSVAPFADEIIVLDSFSTDRTKEIVSSFPFPVVWVERAFQGYGDAKNHLNKLCTGDYVFSIDADEEASKELIHHINERKARGMAADVFYVKRLSNYCGQWIYHGGWNPDIKPRLWRNGMATWNLAEVHEELVFPKSARVAMLEGNLHHYSYNSLAEHKRKVETYSTKGAQRLWREGRRFGFLHLIFSPSSRFVRDYFLKAGFLDGLAGFTIARLTTWETYLKYKKLGKMKH